MNTERNITVLKEKIEAIRFCMLTFIALDGEFSSRPMATAYVGDDGCIWFFSNKHAFVADEIVLHNQKNVTLTYSDPAQHSYLYVNGKVEIVDDQETRTSYHSLMVKAWFPEGLEDTGLILLRVTPEYAEYWDSKSSKLKVAFNMLKAMVTGDKYDEEQHVKLIF
jgi:general stress protein 26